MVPSLQPEAGAGMLAAEEEASSGEADVVGRAAWGGRRRCGRGAEGRQCAGEVARVTAGELGVPAELCEARPLIALLRGVRAGGRECSLACSHVTRLARSSAFCGSGKATYRSPLRSETRETRVCKHQNLTCGTSLATNAWKQNRQPSATAFSASSDALASRRCAGSAPRSNVSNIAR